MKSIASTSSRTSLSEDHQIQKAQVQTNPKPITPTRDEKFGLSKWAMRPNISRSPGESDGTRS
jgi:hypothetical protein